MMDKTVIELASRNRVVGGAGRPGRTRSARKWWRGTSPGRPCWTGDVLVGVVSAWDLLRLQAEDEPGDTPAWRACTYKPLTVRPRLPPQKRRG